MRAESQGLIALQQYAHLAAIVEGFFVGFAVFVDSDDLFELNQESVVLAVVTEGDWAKHERSLKRRRSLERE